MSSPLLCTKCHTPAEIVQDGTAWDDWGRERQAAFARICGDTMTRLGYPAP